MPVYTYMILVYQIHEIWRFFLCWLIKNDKTAYVHTFGWMNDDWTTHFFFNWQKMWVFGGYVACRIYDVNNLPASKLVECNGLMTRFTGKSSLLQCYTYYRLNEKICIVLPLSNWIKYYFHLRSVELFGALEALGPPEWWCIVARLLWHDTHLPNGASVIAQSFVGFF